MNIPKVIKFMYPDASPSRDFNVIQKDGEPYLDRTFWNLPGKPPTDAEMLKVWVDNGLEDDSIILPSEIERLNAINRELVAENRVLTERITVIENTLNSIINKPK